MVDCPHFPMIVLKWKFCPFSLQNRMKFRKIHSSSYISGWSRNRANSKWVFSDSSFNFNKEMYHSYGKLSRWIRCAMRTSHVKYNIKWSEVKRSKVSGGWLHVVAISYSGWKFRRMLYLFLARYTYGWGRSEFHQFIDIETNLNRKFHVVTLLSYEAGIHCCLLNKMKLH